jgi:hypothetical protein
MQTVFELLDHISSDNLPYPHSTFIAEMEAIRARHIVKMREAIPLHHLPPLGYPSTQSFVIAHDGVIQMAEELLARILHGLRPHNAGIYEKLAAQTAKRVREFAHDVLSTFVTFGLTDDDFSDLDCFRQELDATLHNLVQKAITVAWIAHEASYSESAREKARSEAIPGPTGAFRTADGQPGTTGHLDPTDEVSGDESPGGSEHNADPSLPPPAAGRSISTPGQAQPGTRMAESNDATIIQTDSKHKRKGDLSLLAGKRLVNFKVAEEYLGISDRQRQNLTREGGPLKTEGGGHNRKITTESLVEYLRPENPK